LFLPASTRSVPLGLHLALLLLLLLLLQCHGSFNQTCQYFERQLIKHDQKLDLTLQILIRLGRQTWPADLMQVMWPDTDI
jgi:hypothetical protein